ncbi:MAG: thiamine-phosphate kinase [Nostoc sp. NOS(2021)]|uniref:thiamine-phosphate kinase n=1 Tax=Nostoc sp. NOS(2021) TaxID=2815407 RepID=UPI0025CD94A4|nr:thiamine-phosphate kinase [Nostoc sp. NOS(2021)]MBN3895587.1 thiamine-phosphate kinase [Nostoc sp. NOS(2021)]
MNSELASQQVKDIGEQGLLERLQRFCPPEIIGDDAAVLVTAPEQSLVVTTDVLVDGVHFSNLTTSPEDAGWRSAAANLSDLAAMGASPLGITVGLGLPGEVRVSWVERLYQGMTECLQKYNTPIVGGDIVRSPVTTLAITAFGQVHPNQIIRRSAAVIGDAIVVTGVHGASQAGLQLLLHPELGQSLNNEEKTPLIRAHQRPQPRLDVLPILWKILDSQSKIQVALEAHQRCDLKSKIPVAGMDSSDGLADAIIQICRASGVGAVLECRQIPVPKTFNHWLPQEQALEYALYGGEDFELVLCLPQESASALVQHLGEGAAIVGRVTAGSTVLLHDEQKKFPDQVLSLSQGFQHFDS